MENDGGKPDAGVRILGEAGVLVERSDVGAVNSGIKRNDYGYIDDKHDGSKNRVVELMSGDDGWGMMDLVGRVLNGDLGRDEIDKGNVSEDQPEISSVVDLGTIGESTSANAEGNSLCVNPDVVINEKVPDENSEIEGLTIPKVNLYNSERTDVEDPREGTSLNGTHDVVTNELVPGGKLEIGVNTPEADVGTDKRTNIEDSGNITTLNGKQDFLADDIVQAGKLGTEVIKNGKADVVTTRKGGYRISDLVWGKVKSHPWWPGQIFSRSAASDKALKHSKKDGYLIAYFGDQTFAWNEVSKMKPFQINFAEMEKQSNTGAFSYAMNCVVEEVSRRVEVGLSCPCLPVDVLDQIKTQVIENAGIRKESSRRESQDNSFTAASFLPRETTQLVESFAVMPKFVTDRLQFAILKAQLLAFNRWRGVYQLSMFEICGFVVDDETQFNTEVEGIDHPKEVIGVPAASDIVSEVPSKKRKHDEQTAKRMAHEKICSAKKQESIVSRSKEKRKHIELSLRAIDGMDIQPGKKPRVKPIQQTTQSDPKESNTLEMITITPDETVEKLNLAAKAPLQEHDDTMMQTINFLREYRNFTSPLQEHDNTMTL